jgi:DNA-binding transcriptional LysR family regulator
MDLLQLRYFRVVARVEHMTKEAEELSIAQPSLSKTIVHMEKEIGVPLFDRQGPHLTKLPFLLSVKFFCKTMLPYQNS